MIRREVKTVSLKSPIAVAPALALVEDRHGARLPDAAGAPDEEEGRDDAEHAERSDRVPRGDLHDDGVLDGRAPVGHLIGGQHIIIVLHKLYQNTCLCVSFTLEILDPKSNRVAKQNEQKAMRN